MKTTADHGACPMRLQNRQTSEDQAWQIVDRSPWGVLSMVDPEGRPYGAALSFWRQGRTLYFHCAPEGRKAECLKADPHVSICFVAQARMLPEAMTMHYASAVVRGIARPVTDPEEKRSAMAAMCRSFGVSEDHPMLRDGFSACLPKTAVWAIVSAEITGKIKQ